MKKYWLGLVAIVFATGLSAFSFVPEKRSFNDPYWYKVNASDFKVISILGQRTKASAQTAAGCNNSSSTLCARAYTVDPGYSVGDVTAVGSDQITKN